ncbi:hypothetical protein R3W88_014820 [Solanum pinnatisectum]|uniref:Endonuclease/exonuclease/phosphatase domain-containing protein n=1 Tax=Solanum pinnatisectum TaxID=50273 RepID=A0AAV9KST5_9SOLN|nr:hypothetical protein R3W88_014820 [Solanum pinnatisectum]
MIMDKQALETGNASSSSTTMNLEITLMPGGNRIVQETPSMKILLWNCRGANNANFMKNICTLMEFHNQTILALTETRMEDLNKILVSTSGYSRGIALLWRNSKTTIEPFVLTEQEIHATIEVSTSFPKRYISIIYAKNTVRYRKILWENLRSIANKINGPWLKLGGRPINNTKSSNFISCLDDMDMIDLGFTGQKYTWTNKHKNNQTPIMECLDRFLSNHSWLTLFPDTKVYSSPSSPHLKKLFRFETMWIRHPDFPNIVTTVWKDNNNYNDALEKFLQNIKIWNKETFGNIFKQKKKKGYSQQIKWAVVNECNK